MFLIPDDILDFFFSKIVIRSKYRVERIDNKIFIKPRIEQEYYKPVICVNDLNVLKNSLINFINELNVFLNKKNNLAEYHDLAFILNNLLVNMTSSDAIDLASFIDNRTAFLKDNIFNKYLEKKEILKCDNIAFYAQKVLEEYGLETPYVLVFSMKYNNIEYDLPIVRYAIDENKVCHLFTIQTGRFRTTYDSLEFKSVVNQVNSGVKQYRNVSPNFVLSFGLFLKMLKSNNINKIVVPDYLFSRYRNYYRNNNEAKSDMILKRILDNFITLMQRMELQIDGLTIESFPNEIDSYTHISINELKSENKLLSKIINYQ